MHSVYISQCRIAMQNQSEGGYWRGLPATANGRWQQVGFIGTFKRIQVTLHL